MDWKTGVKSVRRKLHCDEHKDEPLKLFCKTCEKVICRDCALVKHRQHDYVFVHEFRHEIQTQLKALAKKAKEKEAEFKVHIGHVAKVRKSSSAAFDASKREANTFFDKMAQSIEARRKKVLTDLDALIQIEEKKLNAETDYLELALARLSNSIHFTKTIFNSEDDVEMMLMSTQAKPVLENLQQLTWDQKKAEVKPVRVIFDQKDIKKCESMGAILSSAPLELKENDVMISKLSAEVRGPLSFDIVLQSQEISELGTNFGYRKANKPIDEERQSSIQSDIGKDGRHVLLTKAALRKHDLLVNCELRQFRCPKCLKPFWKTVLIPKRVARCHQCNIWLYPLERSQEFGVGRFICATPTCDNVFYDRCRATDTGQCKFCFSDVKTPYIHPRFTPPAGPLPHGVRKPQRIAVNEPVSKVHNCAGTCISTFVRQWDETTSSESLRSSCCGYRPKMPTFDCETTDSWSQ
jgi:hypothetical protein